MAERRDLIRELAVSELQCLLKAEPQLAEAFKTLSAKAHHPRLKTFCREGVTYTKRRVTRVKAALNALEAPQAAKPSTGLRGLIADAIRATRLQDRQQRDCAILAALERISHYGLGIYTSIDRYLRALGESKARRAIIPSTKEKRDAIGEASRMARRNLIGPLKRI